MREPIINTVQRQSNNFFLLPLSSDAGFGATGGFGSSAFGTANNTGGGLFGTTQNKPGNAESLIIINHFKI